MFRADYNTNLQVRAMAKLLNLSHMTLLPHLKQLEQLKILKSTRVGRNKNYSLNQSNILTKCYIITIEEIVTVGSLKKNKLLRKLGEQLTTIDTSDPLILFGSYADGTATDESDIDLFSIGTLTRTQLAHIKKFEATYGKKLNIKTASLKRFNTALQTGDILIKEIIRNHIILRNADLFVTMLWRCYAEG